MSTPFTWVGFDADDTLWHSEDWFETAKAAYLSWLTPFVDDPADVFPSLLACERRNLVAFGYGVRAFGLSMVENAVAVTGGRVPAAVLADIVDMTRQHLLEPVRLLPGAAEVVAAVSARLPTLLITKGDLLHQTAKVETSGLGGHFADVHIVLEKDVATYRSLLDAKGIDPSSFCMIGNSIRSDIVPIMELGGHGVHVPYPLLWELEFHDEAHPHQFTELASLAELPAWLGLSG